MDVANVVALHIMLTMGDLLSFRVLCAISVDFKGWHLSSTLVFVHLFALSCCKHDMSTFLWLNAHL